MKVSKWKDCMKHIKTLFFGHFVINCRKIFALVASFFLPDCYFALPTNVFERRNLIQHWITHSLPTDHVCTPPFLSSAPITFPSHSAATWPVLSRPNAVFSDFFVLSTFHIPGGIFSLCSAAPRRHLQRVRVHNENGLMMMLVAL